MPGFEGQVLWCANQNFSDPTASAYHHLGEFLNLGDLAIGTGNAAPAQQIQVGHITGSGGIIVTYPGGIINIDGSGAGGSMVWQNISASQTLTVQNGYFCSGGATLSLALPAVAAVGATIIVYLIGSAGFIITQGAGQQIVLANKSTTAGVGGSIASTQQGDSITLVCQQANLTFVATFATGSLTVV